jgi:hypothetical protein
MDNILLSDIQSAVPLADVKLSSLSLSADALVSTFNSLISSDNAKLPLSGGTLSGSLVVGENSKAIGKDSLAVGTLAGQPANTTIANYGFVAGDGKNYSGMMAFKATAYDISLSTLTLDAAEGPYGKLSDCKAGEDVVVYMKNKEENHLFGAKYGGRTSDTDKVVIKVTDFPFESDEWALKYCLANNKLFVMFPDHPLVGTCVEGDGSVACGYNCIAMEDAAAFCTGSQSLGRYAFSAGAKNKSGYIGTAFGCGNIANGTGSIAMGIAERSDITPTNKSRYGTAAVVNAYGAFAWSGGKDAYVVPNTAERQYTFNVNPKNGLSGFYVGDQSLA